ncbi:MAG: hypothetical protein ABIR96_07960, partial [Bdellovibrionota bacterium]
MSGSDKDDKTGVFKDLKTRVAEKSIQVQMVSGKIYGPYSRNEIHSFIEDKRIRGEEKILFEGETVWKPIASDTEFYDAIHAILSGKKIKRKEIAKNEVSASFDSSDKTRASGPSSTQTEVVPQSNPADRTRFTEFTGGASAPPVWTPPADLPVAPTVARDHFSPQASLPAQSKKLDSPKKPQNKSRIGLVLILAAVFGIGFVVLNKRNTSSALDSKARNFEATSARFYTQPLTAALKELRVTADTNVPA